MRFLKKRYGFSLVEMIIAVGLLGAVTIGTGVYISSSFKNSNKLANKADVQNSVTALMNKIETEIKMADIPVGETITNGFVINGGTQKLNFIHEDKKVMVKIGTNTEATYEYNYIKSINVEFLGEEGKEKGAKITIIGQDELYKLTGTYYTRNTMGSGNLIDSDETGGTGGNGETAIYTLEIQNNGTTSIKTQHEEGYIATVEVDIPQDATWEGWYVNDNWHTAAKEFKIEMDKNIVANAVYVTDGVDTDKYKCKCCGDEISSGDYCSKCTEECEKCTDSCSCGKCKAHCQCTGTKIYCKCCGDEISSGDYCSTCKKACECGCSGKECKLDCGCNIRVTLTYQAKDGYIGAVHSSAETYNITCPNKSVTATVTTTIPKREGYKFIGWGETSTTSEVYMQAKETLELTGNKTIYAYYSNKVNVTYDANGGSFYVGLSENEVIQQEYDKEYTFPSDLESPFGYTFAGWYTQKEGGTEVKSTTKVSTLNDHTLYAHYTQNTYTLTYDANGGKNAPSAQTGTTLTISSTKPTRIGYIFKGWSKSKSATTASYNAGGSITISANTTLYAVWELGQYTLKFNANGGKNAPNDIVITMEDEYDDVDLSILNLTREGYKFLYWSTDKDSSWMGSHYNQDEYPKIESLIVHQIDGTITLYAWWEKQDSTESNTSDDNNNEYWVVFKDPDEGGYESFGGSTHFSVIGSLFVDTTGYLGGVCLKNSDVIIKPYSGLHVRIEGDRVYYHDNGSSKEYSASLDSCLEGDEIVFYIQ